MNGRAAAWIGIGSSLCPFIRGAVGAGPCSRIQGRAGFQAVPFGDSSSRACALLFQNSLDVCMHVFLILFRFTPPSSALQARRDQLQWFADGAFDLQCEQRDGRQPGHAFHASTCLAKRQVHRVSCDAVASPHTLWMWTARWEPNASWAGPSYARLTFRRACKAAMARGPYVRG